MPGLARDCHLSQVLVVHMLDTCAKAGDGLRASIRQELLLSVSVSLETLYRACARVPEGPLTVDGFAGLVELAACGGCQRKGTLISESGLVRLADIHCPLRDGAAASDKRVCTVASTVLGEIAARNFGYAKVTIAEGGSGDPCCDFSVYLDPETAHLYDGQEYLPDDASAPPVAVRARALPPADRGSASSTLRLMIYAPAIEKLLSDVETVAPTSASVLITGETGVGKELIARRLHMASKRASGPFVAVNCGAIPPELVDSTLFGHEKGAFTGAHQRHKGYFERAQDGTLFLDEIDALSASAQVRLLRVLQEGEYESVGGRRPLFSNARVIAATNHLLSELIQSGRFRKDLWFRIGTVHLHVPPLRQNSEALPLLVDHILARLRVKYGRPVHAVSERVVRQLRAHDWPGNIRELEHVLERAFVFARGDVLESVEIGAPAGMTAGPSPDLRNVQPGQLLEPSDQGWQEYRQRLLEREERRYLEQSLRRFGGDLDEIASDMDLTKRSIYLKLRRYGLDANRYRT